MYHIEKIDGLKEYLLLCDEFRKGYFMYGLKRLKKKRGVW